MEETVRIVSSVVKLAKPVRLSGGRTSAVSKAVSVASPPTRPQLTSRNLDAAIRKETH